MPQVAVYIHPAQQDERERKSKAERIEHAHATSWLHLEDGAQRIAQWHHAEPWNQRIQHPENDGSVRVVAEVASLVQQCPQPASAAQELSVESVECVVQ